MHQIGSGVLGPVYRARLSDRDPSHGDRSVALKAFHVDLTPEQTIVFGEALQGIVDLGVSHPALVSPVGAGIADGVPYLACEYVAGDSLDVRMRPRAALAVEVALPYIVGIAEAMDAAHARGLVHGALHMRDVLITSHGACVGGFGIVAALDRVGRRGPLRPPYAAPEQIAGGEWGAAADRYALAAVAWELLTGRRAAPASDGMAGRLDAVLDARTARRLAPPFEAALAAEPDRRPRSARRLAGDLAGALAWDGAAAVRREAGGAGVDGTRESVGGQGAERAARVPALAAGGAAPLEREPVAAAAGGTVMRKRKKRMPWRRKQGEGDWTERALDLGPPDGRSGTDAGDPPAGDAAAGERAADASGSGGDPIDGAPAGRGDAAGHEHDAVGDLELRSGADPLADVAEGLHTGLRDGRRGAVADQEDADLAPEPPAGDGYSPITVGELESRVGSGAASPGPGEEPAEEGSGPRFGGEGGENETGDEMSVRGGPAPVSPEATDEGGIDGDEDGFALTPEEGYDYGLEDEPEPEDPAGDLFDRGPVDEARRLPVALVATIGVAVAVTAFVIGLGWMGGAGDDAAVGGGEAAPPPRADDAGRAFSEAVVDEAVPSAAGAVNDSPEVAVPSPGGGSRAAAAAGDALPGARDAAPGAPAGAVRRPEPVVAPEPVAPPPPVAVPAPEPAVADGRLLVRSMPPGAEVIVNGQSRGTTPLALTELPYGPYEVEVAIAGYPSRRERFVLDAGDPIGSLNADLAAPPAAAPAAGGAAAGSPAAERVEIGSIRAETRPPGAAVWLDQRLVGETPVSISDVPAGARRIEFRLDGYRTWTTTVEVAPATQARVAASLDDAAR